MTSASPRDLGPPPDWPTFLKIIEISQLGLYIQAAATVACLYDHLTTLDLEIELIWRRKVSVVQVLYFLNRYIGEAVLLHGSAYQIWLKGDDFIEACKIGAFGQMILSTVALGCSQCILINRVWCMYNRSRAIITILLGAFVAQIASSVIVIVLNRSLVNVPFHLTSTLNLCYPIGFSSWFFLFWVFIVIFDSLIFSLALWMGIRHWLDMRNLRRQQGSAMHPDGVLSRITLSWVYRGGGFIDVLIRDSIVFPFLSLVICTLNLVSWFGVLPDGWLQISLVLAAASSPILGCRLVLNLRELYYRPFADEVLQPKIRRRIREVQPLPGVT